VGSERLRQEQRSWRVVWGVVDGAHPVDLPGVDRVDREPVLEQGGDDGAVRGFDADGHRVGLGVGAGKKPAEELNDRLCGRRKAAFRQKFSLGIEHTGPVQVRVQFDTDPKTIRTGTHWLASVKGFLWCDFLWRRLKVHGLVGLPGQEGFGFRT
jgi:hypothetical protein